MEDNKQTIKQLRNAMRTHNESMHMASVGTHNNVPRVNIATNTITIPSDDIVVGDVDSMNSNDDSIYNPDNYNLEKFALACSLHAKSESNKGNKLLSNMLNVVSEHYLAELGIDKI